jgi:hypothetical protein
MGAPRQALHACIFAETFLVLANPGPLRLQIGFQYLAYRVTTHPGTPILWAHRDAAQLQSFVMYHDGICRRASQTYSFLRLPGKAAKKLTALVLKARPRAIIAHDRCDPYERFLAQRQASRKQRPKPFGQDPSQSIVGMVR